MSGVDDLVMWLRAQLDDDERVAKQANGMHRWWIDQAGDRTVRDSMRQEIAECPDTYDAGHIARWDPARVLALTAGLRAVIDSFSWEAQEIRAIQILAEALYADRAGYRDEWRP